MIEKFYKIFFADYSRFYKLLNKDNDEIDSAFLTLSFIQAINLITILFVFYGYVVVEDDMARSITGVILFALPFYLNKKWKKQFKEWKKQGLHLKRKGKVNINIVYFVCSAVLFLIAALYIYVPVYGNGK